PTLTGGIKNIFNYKGFNLSASIIYSFGNVMRSKRYTRFTGGRLVARTAINRLFNDTVHLSGGNKPAYFAKRWKNSGDEKATNVPSYVVDSAVSNTRSNVD